MHAYVFTSTLKDMLRPGRVIPWILLAIVLGLVALLWKTMSRDPLGGQEYGSLVRLIVYRIVALSAAMFTTMVISQEVEQKTIVYLVTRTVPRRVALISRSAAAVVAVTLTSWVTLIAIAFVVLGPGFLGQSMFWMDMLVMFLGAAAYSALFVLITLLLNKAMIVILLFTFIWEAIVPFLSGDMYLLTVITYMSVLAAHPGKTEGITITAMKSEATAVNPIYAWLILPGVAIGLLMLGAWWFSRFEYLPREDAE